MVHVPAGRFIMGTNYIHSLSDAKPRRRVYLDGFYIDKYEVTNARFRAAGLRPKEDYGSKFGGSSQPVVGVTWHQAKAYCEKVGKRLPTEAQWEKAARGTDGRKYPWGNEDPSCSRTIILGGCGREGTWPVGSRPRDVSPYGAHDMGGNVGEWVNDRYNKSYYKRAPDRNPRGPDAGSRRVTRGGSWVSTVTYFSRAADRYGDFPNIWLKYWGFRCAKASR